MLRCVDRADRHALWKGRSVTSFEQTIVERGLEEWSDVSLSWVQRGGVERGCLLYTSDAADER